MVFQSAAVMVDQLEMMMVVKLDSLLDDILVEQLVDQMAVLLGNLWDEKSVVQLVLR